MKTKKLQPIKESPLDYAAIEAEVTRTLRKEMYEPLMRALPPRKRHQLRVRNSMDDLLDAIVRGKIFYFRGGFTGDFNSRTSAELERAGAVWDKSKKQWKFPTSKLSPDLKEAIAKSEARFQLTLDKIDKALSDMAPEQIAEQMQLSKMFDTTLWRIDRQFKKTVDGIRVAPDLSKESRKKIADEYTNNMKLYIRGWIKEEIPKLRKQVEEHAYKGNRYEELAAKIESEYGVGHRKAKFLARQETSLMMTKFKEARYTDAGVNEYQWGCVAGSAKHPVRPMHKALEGKIFRWDNPPITNDKGKRNNPGQDFNCRCFARPIVKF